MPMHPKSFRVNKTVEMVDGIPINIFTLDVYYEFNTVLLNVGIFEEYEDAYEFGTLLISKGHVDLIEDPVFQLARFPYVKKRRTKGV